MTDIIRTDEALSGGHHPGEARFDAGASDGPEILPIFTRIQLVCGIVVGATGLVVLTVGWFFGVDIVTRLHSSLVSMKANTAVGFVLVGAMLLGALDRRLRNVGGAAAAVLATLGVATVLQYGVDVDFGIDELLAQDTTSTGTSSPGRMGLNTAIGFALLGLGRIAGLWSPRGPGAVVQRLATAFTAFLSLLAAAGYLYSATSTRGLGSATEMAIHTAVAFLFACVGMLPVVSRSGILHTFNSPFAGGEILRRVLPVLVIVMAVVALSVASLETVGLLDEPELVLAYLTTATVLALVGATLVAAQRVDEADRTAEQARHEANRGARELAALLSVFDDDHFRVTTGGRIVSALDDLEDAVIGRSLVEILPSFNRSELMRALADVGGEPVTLTATETLDDGPGHDSQEPRTVGTEVRLARLSDFEVSVAVRDVSDLVIIRDQLRRLNAELEDRVAERTIDLAKANDELSRSNRDLEQFAYLASHDLQEPLRMVSSFVRKIEQRYGDELDDRGRQYIDFAVDGATRMQGLIEALLRYSRAGRTELQLVDLDLGLSFATLIQTMQSRITELGATVRLEELPVVRGDEVLLAQVFQNLLTNAMKFVPDDRAPEVVVGARIVDAHLVDVTVDDNGIGIDPKFRDHVFEMFKRLHSRAEYDGTGIGLSIANRIVERHNGTIAVEDSPLGGTRFRVRLPRAGSLTGQ